MQSMPLLLQVYILRVITLLQGNAKQFLNICNEKYYSIVKIHTECCDGEFVSLIIFFILYVYADGINIILHLIIGHDDS